MRSLPLAAFTLVLAVLSGACAPTGSTEAVAPMRGVIVQMFRYQPERIEVPSGAELTWTNRDEILHTVTAGTPEDRSDAFDGQMEGVGATFTHFFADPGEFAYFCARHNGMTGTVVVT